MPRVYKRKTERQNWSVEAMQAALKEVEEGIPYKTAARKYEVPVMALKRRAKGINKSATGSEKILGSRRPVFTKEQEKELVAHLHDMETRMFGLTVKDVMDLAFQLAEKNHIKHPFSTEKRKAGFEWLRGFRKRNPDITLRTPEATSAARARAFNKPVVDKFFAILHEIQDAKRFSAHRIYNVDETGLSTVPTRNTKTFAKTGRKQVARVTSAERGETTTAVMCMSASGIFVPPMLIFKRVRMNLALMEGAPVGSVYACNPSGWMRLEVFAEWFDHFLRHVKPTEDDPALLILDGHLSHTKNLEVIQKARENYVTILCLPPHCTHKLQPLDVGVMFSLSTYHNQALEKWMNNNPGRVVTVHQISKIFNEAYLKAAVPLNAINGFKKCGIFPYNPDVFAEEDFIAAETTDQKNEEPTVPPSFHDNMESETEQFESEGATETVPDAISKHNEAPANSVAFCPLPDGSADLDSQDQTLKLIKNKATTNSVTDNLTHLPGTDDDTGLPITPPKIKTNEGASTSFAFTVSPRDILPLPKMVGKRSIKQRQTGTKVLTSSPYKNQLEEEKQRKDAIDLKRKQKEENKFNKKMKPNDNAKPKKTKTKINLKKKERKQDLLETDDEADDDTECIYCNSKYSKDKGGEGWIQCSVCKRWGHDECAGIDESDTEPFVCEWCNEWCN